MKNRKRIRECRLIRQFYMKKFATETGNKKPDYHGLFVTWDSEENKYCLRGEGLPAHPDLKQTYPNGWSLLDYVSDTELDKILGERRKPVAPRNTAKRILSVKVKRMLDTDPDTSYLGEYSNTAKTEFAIDRAHSEDCASLKPLEPPTNPELTAYECGACNCIHPWNFTGDCREDKNRFGDITEFADSKKANVSDIDLRTDEDRELIDSGECAGDDYCNCGGHNVSSREYRYFNGPVENYKGCTPEEIRKYVHQDYERMESYNNHNWYYLGIHAEAEIMLRVLQENADSLTGPIQTITSGGLWGIESDSDKEYLVSVEKEELADLKIQLLALGFSKRAISTAFKNVQEVSE